MRDPTTALRHAFLDAAPSWGLGTLLLSSAGVLLGGAAVAGFREK